MDTLKAEVHEGLRKLQTEGPVYVHAGICANVNFLLKSIEFLPDSLPYLEALWCNWPHFSGDHRFPVPHPTLPPMLAYAVASNKQEGHWLRAQGEAHNRYVQKRYELLDFLIEATKP